MPLRDIVTETCLPVSAGIPLRPPLTAAAAADYALLGKALADETRVQIVRLLAEHDQPLCVCHLESAFGLTQSGISYHLKVLRDAGLVKTQRRGTWIYYQLDRRRWQALVSLLEPEASPR